MASATQMEAGPKLHRFLLICGILAPALYAGTDILASSLYPGYSFVDQAVSELFAIGAPTSYLVVPLFTAYSLLVLAFAFGVRGSAGRILPLEENHDVRGTKGPRTRHHRAADHPPALGRIAVERVL